MSETKKVKRAADGAPELTDLTEEQRVSLSGKLVVYTVVSLKLGEGEDERDDIYVQDYLVRRHAEEAYENELLNRDEEIDEEHVNGCFRCSAIRYGRPHEDSPCAGVPTLEDVDVEKCDEALLKPYCTLDTELLKKAEALDGKYTVRLIEHIIH